MISEYHKQWLGPLASRDNNTWKKNVLEELEILSNTDEYSSASEAGQLQLILRALDDKVKETPYKKDNPSTLFRVALEKSGYSSNEEKTDDSGNKDDFESMYDFFRKNIFMGEEVEHENLMKYIKAMIVWDKLEVFPDNKTWKDGVLEELKELLQTSSASNADQLQLILNTLDDKVKETPYKKNNPSTLFRKFLEENGYSSNEEKTDDSGNKDDFESMYDFFRKNIFLDEEVEPENLMRCIKAIGWDELNFFPEREKGLLEEIYRGVDFEGNTNASSMVEERMSIAIQFLIGTANLVLKKRRKQTVILEWL